MSRPIGMYSKIYLLLIFFIVFAITPSFLFGDEEKDKRPERGIAVYTEYSGVIASIGESVKMDLIVDNNGQKDEAIDLNFGEVPTGWKALLKAGAYGVTGIFVPAGKSRNLPLTLEPGRSVGPGTYEFQYSARSRDGVLVSTHKLNVIIKERVAISSDILITTSYPVLRGQPDSRFEFSLDILNKGDTDRTFNLSAVGPDKWEINFKPAAEFKQISSLRIKGGQAQGVSVEVNPLKEAKAGEYPVMVRVSSGDKYADVRLMIVLTGTYNIEAGTTTGILSLEATRDQPVSFSIFVKNTGSALNKDITFTPIKPENWEVKFKPEKIEALEPGAFKQVDVTVKPSQQALVGDYSLGMVINGEKSSSKSIEMRITVKASTAWGWIGIGIILFVIAGLSTLFILLGRR